MVMEQHVLRSAGVNTTLTSPPGRNPVPVNRTVRPGTTATGPVKLMPVPPPVVVRFVEAPPHPTRPRHPSSMISVAQGDRGTPFTSAHEYETTDLTPTRSVLDVRNSL